MIDHSPSDAELLEQFLRQGTEDAFAQLVTRHSHMVFGVCVRVLGNPMDAEDAAQATFIALALKGKRLNATTGLGGWLHKVARQVSLDIRKSQVRSQQRVQGYQVLQQEHAPAGVDLLLNELDAAISGLPVKLRSALLQSYFEDRSIEEIARSQGCSPSAISMRLTRAKGELRKRLPALLTRAVPVAVLLQTASTGYTLPGGFVTQTAPTVLTALKGVSASETAVASLLALARETLRKLALAKLRLPVALTATAIAAVGVVMADSKAVQVPIWVEPRVAMVVERSEADPSVKPPLVSPKMAQLADPPLIAALGKIKHWRDVVIFKAALDQVSGDVDGVRDDREKTALHRAAALGYSESSTLLLLRGSSVTATDREGKTPLFDAVEAGARWTIELLILAGADINHKAIDGSTPLTVALGREDPATVELLLWLGAKSQLVNIPSTKQPLAIAHSTGNPELLKLVQDYAVLNPPTFIQQPRVIPGFLKNRLQNAAQRADFVILEDSLRAGASLNEFDERGKSALHRAILGGHAEMVFYLLLLGAEVNLPDRAGITPLMESLAWLGDGGGNATRLFLIIKGANPHAIRADGHSEITFAADRGNDHSVQWLLWLGVDARAGSLKGTPSQVAWRAGREPILQLLRRYGVDEPLQLPDEAVPLLHLAAKLGKPDLIDQALAAGAPIDEPNEEGNSALMLSLLTSNTETARMLIERGADIEFQNPVNHQTPLCSTMPWNGKEINSLRRELLAAGVNVNIQTKRNRTTPLMMALIHGDWLLKELVAHGADIHASDKDSKTVLTHALETGRNEAVTYLRSLGASETGVGRPITPVLER
jgi:RNA polymerase sigma factor (sigma-70 family)